MTAFDSGHLEAGLAAAHLTYQLDGGGRTPSRHTASAELYWRVILCTVGRGSGSGSANGSGSGSGSGSGGAFVGDEACVFGYDNCTVTVTAAAAAAASTGSSGGGVTAVRAEACNALGLLLETGAASADGSALVDCAASLFLVAATTGYPQAWLNLLPLLTDHTIASSKVCVFECGALCHVSCVMFSVYVLPTHRAIYPNPPNP